VHKSGAEKPTRFDPVLEHRTILSVVRLPERAGGR